MQRFRSSSGLRRGAIGVDEVVHFRPRRRWTPSRPTVMILNLAPMVDVVFLLLIFFIVTTTFKRAEGLFLSKLPRQGGLADVIALPITPIVVRLRQGGPGPGDYAISIDNFVNAPTNANELAAFLKDVQANPGFDEETPVVIQADPDVAWDHVVACWNAAVRAGCQQITFGAE